MMYVLIIIISLVLSAMSFAGEITQANITHIKNGREPDAGAALFPTIPFIPLFIVLLTWGLNTVYENLGFYSIIGCFVAYLPIWYFSYRTSVKELKSIANKQSMNDYITIYDLKRNRRHIKDVQNASLHSDDCGLVTKPELFGSSKWWKLVGTDQLPIHTLEGIITKVYMSGHNDFPEFEMDDGNKKTTWMRRGEDSAYMVGRPIRMKYVEMKYKKPINCLPPFSQCILSIEVGMEEHL